MRPAKIRMRRCQWQLDGCVSRLRLCRKSSFPAAAGVAGPHRLRTQTAATSGEGWGGSLRVSTGSRTTRPSLAAWLSPTRRQRVRHLRRLGTAADCGNGAGFTQMSAAGDVAARPSQGGAPLLRERCQAQSPARCFSRWTSFARTRKGRCSAPSGPSESEGESERQAAQADREQNGGLLRLAKALASPLGPGGKPTSSAEESWQPPERSWRRMAWPASTRAS